VLEEQTAGDGELTNELIQLCLKEVPGLLDQIRKAVAARDPQAINFSAHTLKGALMNFGAQRAVAASLRLETLGRERSLEGVDESFRELEGAWTVLERELQAHLR
jgi:HPt (histidine-containing phosphotransfer) domain-containing protein